jgi:hypothetical protein
VSKDVPSSSAVFFVWREAIKSVLREKDELNAAFSEMAVERAQQEIEKPKPR